MTTKILVKVARELEALVRFFSKLKVPMSRIGLEARPLSQWPHAGLGAAGFEVVLLETRHVKAALSVMMVKTDSEGRARDRAVPADGMVSAGSRQVDRHPRYSCAARWPKVAERQAARRRTQYSWHPARLRLKVGEVSRGRFEARIQELTAGHVMLETVIGAMLTARARLWREFTKLHCEMLKIARADKIYHQLMSTPGAGALVALTYRSTVDDPGRFSKSRTVRACFGLAPKKYQSGEADRDGGVSKVGDAMVRTGLFETAHIMLTRATRFSSLKRWALECFEGKSIFRSIGT